MAKGRVTRTEAAVAHRPVAPYLVFLSHATADKWLACALCERIEAAGAKTFRDDRDIDGGDDIPDALRDAIRRANEMVVLLTPASVSRPWVLMEIGAAWQRGQDMSRRIRRPS